MQKILHQLIGTLSHYLPGLIDPRWCRISSITSIMSCFFKPSSFNNLRFSSQFFNTHRFVDSTSMSFSVSAKILETKKFLEDWVVVSNIFYFHPETWGIFSPNVIFFRWVCLNSTTNQKTSNYPDHALGFCLGSPTQRCESPVNHWSRGEGAWDPKSSTLIFVKKNKELLEKDVGDEYPPEISGVDTLNSKHCFCWIFFSFSISNLFDLFQISHFLWHRQTSSLVWLDWSPTIEIFFFQRRSKVQVREMTLYWVVATQRFFDFHPETWRNNSIWLYNIFQMGWFNHQLIYKSTIVMQWWMNELQVFFPRFAFAKVGDFSWKNSTCFIFMPWLQAGVWLLNLAELSSFKDPMGRQGGTLEVAHSQEVQVDQTLRIGSWESLIHGSS